MSAATTLLHRIGGTRRWIVVSTALGTLTIAAGIGLVALSTHLITMSEFYGSAATMAMVILGVRATAIARVVARYCDRYVGHLGTFRVLTRLRVWTYSSLLTAEPLGDARHPRGEIVTALVDDVESMQDHLLRVAVPPWVAIGSLAVGGVALAAIAPSLAVVGVLAFAVATIPTTLVLRRLVVGPGRIVTDLRAERMARATEDIDVLDELVAWGRVDHLTNALASIERREAPAARRLTSVRSGVEAVAALASGFGAIALAAIALRTPMEVPWVTWLVAAPVIGLATFEAVGPVLSAAERSASTDAAGRRILSLVDDHRPTLRPSPVPVDTVGTTPDLHLDDVSFAFPSGPVILHHATATIPWGTTAVIVAPSGTGKSTLVDLLVGLRSPDAGAVRVDRSDVRSIDHEGGRTVIAAVLQDDHVFDTTVRDNVVVGNGDADDALVVEALRVAGLVALTDERTLDAPVGEDGSNLSGGERQRLLVTRALASDAPILVLDEAGEHLDRDLRRQVVEQVLEMRRGRTTIVFAHDADALINADVVFELRDGSLHILER